MKILFYSPAFLPQIGGLELNVAHLAEELAAAGNEVTVVTTTPGDREPDGGYRTVRRPSPRILLRWTRWCDVYFQANVSLRGLWPLLLVRRPWLVSHHSWYCRSDGRITLPDRLKRWLPARAAASIAVSEALARDLHGATTVIPNCYRDQLFRELPGSERDRDLLFVGRLVSDKGADLLLAALAQLAAGGVRPTLSIVGEGPERAPLTAAVGSLELGNQVSFLGVRTGEGLVEIMNQHRILVVPSRYHEPFGIVALEGLACGCVVVGSQGGGLREAIGGCGLTFRNGDVAELAATLRQALSLDAAGRERLLAGRRAHLARHSTRAIVARYLEALDAAVAGRTVSTNAPAAGSS